MNNHRVAHYFLICFTTSSRRQVIYRLPTLKQWERLGCPLAFQGPCSRPRGAKQGPAAWPCRWQTPSPRSAAPAPLKSRLSIQKIPPCISRSREGLTSGGRQQVPWLEAKSSDTAKVKCLDLRLDGREGKSNEVKESLNC